MKVKEFKKTKADINSRLVAGRQRVASALMGAGASVPMVMAYLSAYAAPPEVNKIAKQIIQWVGAGGIVIGVITIIVGIMTFFGAEDDGPQKSKGKGQIAAGVGVTAVGGAMATETMASTIAGWISGAFS